MILFGGWGIFVSREGIIVCGEQRNDSVWGMKNVCVVKSKNGCAECEGMILWREMKWLCKDKEWFCGGEEEWLCREREWLRAVSTNCCAESRNSYVEGEGMIV